MTNERRAELQELATITPCFNDLAQQIAREALAEAEAAERMREAIMECWNKRPVGSSKITLDEFLPVRQSAEALTPPAEKGDSP